MCRPSICPECGWKRPSVTSERMKCVCGLVFASETTIEKYQTLEEICKVNDYNRLIDACAGSGVVGSATGIVDGSPIRLANIAKEKNLRCIFVESDEKTIHLLKSSLKKRGFSGGPSFEVIHGNCNDYLPSILDDAEPTLVYIDPFGIGTPPIKRKLITKIAQKENIDLLVHFSWRICRQMGFTRAYLNSPLGRNRLTAEAYKRSLDCYWGSHWISWPSMRTYKYAVKYIQPLKNNNKTQIIGLPRDSPAKFFLIFVTKQNLLKLGLEKFMR